MAARADSAWMGVGALTGALVALGALAGVNAWFGGAARVPFAAGVDARAAAVVRPARRPRHAALRRSSRSVITSTLIFLPACSSR